MNTSPIERVEMDVDFALEPACEGKDCDRPAVAVVRYVCGCIALACAECIDETARDWQVFCAKNFAWTHCRVRCPVCKVMTLCQIPDQPWTVVPL